MNVADLGIYGHMILFHKDAEPVEGDTVTTMCGKRVVLGKSRPKRLFCGRCVELMKEEHHRLIEAYNRQNAQLRNLKSRYEP